MKVNQALTNPTSGQSSRTKFIKPSELEPYKGGTVPAAQTNDPPTPASEVKIQYREKDPERKPV